MKKTDKVKPGKAQQSPAPAEPIKDAPMGHAPVMTMIEAIKEYQVPGAVNDFDPKTYTIAHGWKEHCPGTTVWGAGRIMLGMPKGFNRLGPLGHVSPPDLFPSFLQIYETWEDHKACWGYDKLNIPCWKHLDEHGNTLVRGLSPRVNTPFVHIILGNHMDKIECLEITAKDIEEMD